jgi:hypothetical protein
VSAEVKAALAELTERVMGRAGVTGTALGQRGGKPCLLVYLASADAARGIPGSVRGVPVRTEVTGRIRRQ